MPFFVAVFTVFIVFTAYPQQSIRRNNFRNATVAEFLITEPRPVSGRGSSLSQAGPLARSRLIYVSGYAVPPSFLFIFLPTFTVTTFISLFIALSSAFLNHKCSSSTLPAFTCLILQIFCLWTPSHSLLPARRAGIPAYGFLLRSERSDKCSKVISS